MLDSKQNQRHIIPVFQMLVQVWQMYAKVCNCMTIYAKVYKIIQKLARAPKIPIGIGIGIGIDV